MVVPQAFQEKAERQEHDKKEGKEGRALLSIDTRGSALVGGRRGLQGQGAEEGGDRERGEGVDELLQQK